jgi:hypothetical protein
MLWLERSVLALAIGLAVCAVALLMQAAAILEVKRAMGIAKPETRLQQQ